jgi:hypothetical protein
LRATRGHCFLALVTREKLDHLLTDAIEVCAEFDENLCGDAVTFTDET